MAVVHISGAYIFIQSGVKHFSEIQDGGRRNLEFVVGSHGTTHEGSFVVQTPCKNFVMIG